ncbi:hypothetical protein [Sphingomonas sp. GV3]|uniref:hypothetical protein n=1 Tax=Sphingomonas sp. GV3 TaxID=3040671 RepID=UPI00280BB359|nr:hypothetical protein [Sphingomonas sp. GV3]
MLEGLTSIIGSSFERAPWGWGLLLTVTVALIRGWPAIVDATTKAKTALGDRRLSRIEKLEAKIEVQNASHEVEVGLLRHQLNNVIGCLDALLLLIETAPDKAAEHAARIRAMRKEQSKTAVVEKATIKGTRVAVAEAAALVAEKGVS